MDLNPFHRFSTEFSAFLLVPCTHYFLAICGLLTPDFMYWPINHTNAIFEGFYRIQNFYKPISYRGVESYPRFLQEKPNSKWSVLCARKRNWWWFISLYFSDDKANVALNVYRTSFFCELIHSVLEEISEPILYTVCVCTRNRTSYHRTEL